MEKNHDNKADYFFGSKPVLERAEDENEFEGSLTTSTELTNLTFIHEIPSAFWRSIWLDFANQGQFYLEDQNFETGELKFAINKKTEATKQHQNLWSRPIWIMTSETALYKGWTDWDGACFLSVFELIGLEDLKEVVKSYIWSNSPSSSPSFVVQLNEMQHDPADLVHIRTWRDFWAAAANGRRHEIDTVVKTTGGPDMVVCLQMGANANNKVWIAKKERNFYAVWTGSE
jgi:hypothetical protein